MSSVNTFLVEIIIVTLFFSLCVAITLQLFVAAHTKSSLNSDINIATIKVQTQAETIKSLNRIIDADAVYNDFKKEIIEGKTQYQILYDKNWTQTKNNPRYVINVQLKEEPMKHSNIIEARIEAYKITDNKRELLCDIETKNYVE